MNDTKEMLNYIYQNSQMGVNTMEQLLDISKDEEFLKLLKSQWSEYKKINDEALDMIKSRGIEEKGVGTMGEISTYMMINIKTLMDKSTSHIAEMMMGGSTMGIVQATKSLKKLKLADEKAVKLMERLIKTEENNFQRLKDYL